MVETTQEWSSSSYLFPDCDIWYRWHYADGAEQILKNIEMWDDCRHRGWTEQTLDPGIMTQPRSRNMALRWISSYLDTLLHVDYCWCSARLAGNHIIPAPIFGPALTTFSVFLPRPSVSLSLTITSLNQNIPALFPRLLHIMKLGVIAQGLIWSFQPKIK